MAPYSRGPVFSTQCTNTSCSFLPAGRYWTTWLLLWRKFFPPGYRLSATMVCMRPASGLEWHQIAFQTYFPAESLADGELSASLCCMLC
eukprot:3052788-Rhodomonas_salina.1